MNESQSQSKDCSESSLLYICTTYALRRMFTILLRLTKQYLLKHTKKE